MYSSAIQGLLGNTKLATGSHIGSKSSTRIAVPFTKCRHRPESRVHAEQGGSRTAPAPGQRISEVRREQPGRLLEPRAIHRNGGPVQE